jgi:16S rRNA (uracil1498-N3)-methyltransferase
MSYFQAPVPLAVGATVTLEGEEAAHLLKSRRLRAGETFALQDPSGARFLAELAAPGRRGAAVRVLQPLPVPALPERRVLLLLAAVKDKALEWTLQKATELGVAAIQIFPARHSPVSPADLAAPRTAARWERIAREACKQCDRQFPPALGWLPGLDAALAAARSASAPGSASPGGATRGSAAWLLDPHAPRSLADALRALPPGGAASIAILIGPEGGLTGEETAAAQGAGFQAVGLGTLTLRAETAALAACALALFGPGKDA